MVSRASRLLAGAAALVGCALAPHASAQNNPFVPASQAQRADIKRMVVEEVEAVKKQILADVKAAAPKAGTPGVPDAAGIPGAPGVPGAPMTPGGPLAPGVGGVPGYPPVGPNGGPVVQAAPQSPIEEARSSGTRFLGCINGVHKFMKSSGERVSFPDAQINRAVKDGVLPACR